MSREPKISPVNSGYAVCPPHTHVRKTQMKQICEELPKTNIKLVRSKPQGHFEPESLPVKNKGNKNLLVTIWTTVLPYVVQQTKFEIQKKLMNCDRSYVLILEKMGKFSHF